VKGGGTAERNPRERKEGSGIQWKIGTEGYSIRRFGGGQRGTEKNAKAGGTCKEEGEISWKESVDELKRSDFTSNQGKWVRRIPEADCGESMLLKLREYMRGEARNHFTKNVEKWVGVLLANGCAGEQFLR